MARTRVIIFIRVPKTSTSTICGSIIGPQYKPPSLKIIDGHYPFNIHKSMKIDIKKVSYFTFLRDPIERWQSVFCQNLRDSSKNENVMKTMFEDADRNPVKFLEGCLEKEIHCNVITKQISGAEKAQDMYRGVNKSYKQYYSPMYCMSLKRYTAIEMEKMAETAIHNLKDHFDFVGTTENSKEDYQKLCLHYGWKYKKPTTFEKVAKRGTKKEMLKTMLRVKHPKVQELLREINKYDIEVYNSIA